MIRFIFSLSLFVILIFVLYVPSKFPPEHFIALMRQEHQAHTQYWDHTRANRILANTLTLMQNGHAALPQHYAAQSAIDQAVNQEVQALNQRIINNQYFRSIDALYLLSHYRLGWLLEWLPIIVIPGVAAVIDGLLIRRRRVREFVQHNPELFGLFVCTTIAVCCACFMMLTFPATIHPLWWIVLPSVAVTSFALAITHYRAI